MRILLVLSVVTCSACSAPNDKLNPSKRDTHDTPVFAVEAVVDDQRLSVDGVAHPYQTSFRVKTYGSDGSPSKRAFVLETSGLNGVKSENLMTAEDGTFTRIVTAGTRPGQLVFSISGGKTAANITVFPGQLNELVYLPAPVTEIASLEFGGPDRTILTWVGVDKFGNSVTEPIPIDFELSQAPSGTMIAPATGVLQAGAVTTSANAGLRAGNVIVRARTGSVFADSETVNIWRPVAADKISLSVDRTVLSGFLVGGLESELTVLLSDRFGMPPSWATEVFFACEAGDCDSVRPGRPDINGRITTTFLATVDRMPLYHGDDAKVVFPALGTAHGWPALGNRLNGWANIVAYTFGESAYQDFNGNGLFDIGLDTLLEDPSEPYLDNNENGTWDPGEWFTDWDVDGFTSHEVPEYHTRQLIWDSSTVIYADEPAVQAVPDQFIDMNADGSFDPVTDMIAIGGPVPTALPFPSPATLFASSGYQTASTMVFVNFTDKNGNPLPAGSEIAGTLVAAASGINLRSLSPASYLNGEFWPKEPVWYQLTEATPFTNESGQFEFCATVSVADAQQDYQTCIQGFRF